MLSKHLEPVSPFCVALYNQSCESEGPGGESVGWGGWASSSQTPSGVLRAQGAPGKERCEGRLLHRSIADATANDAVAITDTSPFENTQ
jgi:hypothetical protein